MMTTSPRQTAVQVNWTPPRPITDRERELLARTMRRAAQQHFEHWEGDGREAHELAET